MFSNVERQNEQNKPHITSNDGAIKCCQLLFLEFLSHLTLSHHVKISRENTAKRVYLQ
jgi:hypothetical protein